MNIMMIMIMADAAKSCRKVAWNHLKKKKKHLPQCV